MVAAIFIITIINVFITRINKIAWLMSSNRTETIGAASHLTSVSCFNFVAVLHIVARATIMGAVYSARPAIKFISTISTHCVGFVRRKFSSQRD